MEHDKMSLQYDIQINNRGHMLVHISHKIDTKSKDNGLQSRISKKLSKGIQEMFSHNQTKTVSFFIANFKINKNYQ
jgi:hypothetical protein